METATTTHTYPFLAGGGELGERTRQYDWSTTALGTPDQWPRSLQTTVGLVLHSAFPMFLFWGDQLLCFYNDAYRPSLGSNGKHPTALGRPAKDVWPEAWTFISPLVDQVVATGEAVWFEDQLVPIHRNGRLEDVYWTFSYSPAFGDDGQISGVLVTCTETTTTVLSRKKLEETQRQLLSSFEQSPVGIALIDAEDLVFRMANSFYGHLVGRRPEEIVGKPLLEALPELRGQGFDGLLNNVIATGTPFIANEVSVELVRNNRLETIYVDMTYQPRREADETIGGVLVVVTDVTPQVLSRQKIEESEARFRTLVNESPVAACLFKGPELIIDVANERMIRFFGRGPAIVGKPVRDVLTEPAGDEPAITLLERVFTTGEPFTATAAPAELTIDGKPGTYYFDLSLKPLRNAAGEVYAILETATDVTDRVTAQEQINRRQQQILASFEQAPVAIAVLTNPNLTYRMANANYCGLLGRPADQLLGKPLSEAIPEAAERGFVELLEGIIASNQAYEAREAAFTVQQPNGLETRYFDYTYQPWREDGRPTGVMVVATDVTEQVVARRTVQESEAQLRSLIEEAPVATCLFVGRAMRIDLANEAMIRIWGKGWSVIGQPLAEALPELRGQHFLPLLDKLYATGETYETKAGRADLVVDGVLQTFYFDYSFKPLRNVAGDVYAIMEMAVDVTEEVINRKKLEEAESTLRGAIELAELGTWQIDLATGMLTYSERLRNWFGIAADERITIERAYQAIRETDRPLVQAAMIHAITPGTDGLYRVEYRTNPGGGGPERILLAQGKAFVNGQGTVYRVSGTAQDVTRQRQVQQALEQQVQARTQQLQASVGDLERSNQNLQQFAYVASHDLQEPLRKIQSFGDLLKNQYATQLGEGIDHLERMQSAAGRMSTLIRDLLAFSRISTQQNTNAPVALTDVVHTVLNDLDLILHETGAQVTVDPLPTVSGDQSQLEQLFQNLLSNALKFRRTNPAGVRVTPIITVRTERVAAADLPPLVRPARLVDTYHRIDVTDNGIGFDQKYVDRIFQVFQRLHGRNEFAGTGIGLAICEKVAANHGGTITATSQPGQGATFSVYLPC